MGAPVEIQSTSSFDKATITFKYDEKELGDVDENNLRVMWYDEINNKYEILDDESVLDTKNNTISYTTTHFSTYMVVDRVAWYETWRKAISYGRKSSSESKTTYYDISYLIDTSGSMAWDGSLSIAKKSVKDFIEAMYSNDRGAIIGFDSRATIYQGFTGNKDKLISAVNELGASGGTSVESGLVKAINLFENTDPKKVKDVPNSKMILLICDGDVSYKEATLERAKKDKIKIYTILIGATEGKSKLQTIADETGGKFYYAKDANEIRKAIFGAQSDSIGEIDKTDTDGDGLYDIYETAGMMLPNGKHIYTDAKKKDTDGDGLSDAEEMGALEEFDNQSRLKQYILKLKGFDDTVYAQYFNYKSNPNKKDSDRDTVPDKKDPLKLKKGISEVLSSGDYDNLKRDVKKQVDRDYSLKLLYKPSGPTTKKCVDRIIKKDKIITNLSNKYLMPKSIIQAVLFRELRCYDALDQTADGLVVQQFNYQRELEEYLSLPSWQQLLRGCPQIPVPYREDSSTGLAQVTAETAIKANNWAIKSWNRKAKKYNYSNWKDRKEVWYKLKDNDNYCLEMETLVLAWGVSDYDETTLHYNSKKYWDYNVDQVKHLIARYNGTKAKCFYEYAQQTIGTYIVFKKYN